MAFGTLVRNADIRLRDWLKKDEVREGNRLPSERSLAKLLGVQHYALNRAMARLIAEGQIVREGYKLYFVAEKAPTVPFCCHMLISSRSGHLKSYRRIAAELGIETQTHHYTSVEDSVATLRKLDSADTHGILFDPPHGLGINLWERPVLDLVEHRIPIVCLGNFVNGAPSVIPDDPGALKLIFEHLTDLGHREIAFMCPPPVTPASSEVPDAWSKLCMQYGLANSAKRIHIPNNSAFLREDLVELAAKLTSDWKKVTAMVLHSENESSVSLLIQLLAKRKKNIPRDLSLICLRDSNTHRTETPPVSVARVDATLLQEIAFRMVQRLFRRKNDVAVSYSTGCIRIQAELIPRASTALISMRAPFAEERPSRTSVRPTSSDRDEKQNTKSARNLKFSLRQPYPLVARAENSRFLQLDLKSQVNRPLNFRRGWLGDLPLKYLPPGEHVIHGVPFQVLGGVRRTDCGAVVFQSMLNMKGNAQKLPSILRLPIQAKATAIYFLHGCGFARFLQTFAVYSFYQGKKKIDEVPLIPLGQPPMHPDVNAPGIDYSKANIQDWWPDLPQKDLAQARMAPIEYGEITDLNPRHVYLYTLEWVNPFPEKTISYLEIKADASQSTTLGVLGISVLKPLPSVSSIEAINES